MSFYKQMLLLYQIPLSVMDFCMTILFTPVEFFPLPVHYCAGLLKYTDLDIMVNTETDVYWEQHFWLPRLRPRSGANWGRAGARKTVAPHASHNSPGVIHPQVAPNETRTGECDYSRVKIWVLETVTRIWLLKSMS